MLSTVLAGEPSPRFSAKTGRTEWSKWGKRCWYWINKRLPFPSQTFSQVRSSFALRRDEEVEASEEAVQIGQGSSDASYDEGVPPFLELELVYSESMRRRNLSECRVAVFVKFVELENVWTHVINRSFSHNGTVSNVSFTTSRGQRFSVFPFMNVEWYFTDRKT